MKDTAKEMNKALTPKTGTKRKVDNPTLAEKARITHSDMAGPNSYGDGKTLYIHGKTFNPHQ